MTDAEDAAEKWWKEKMAEDVPNNDDLDDLAVAFLDGVERGKDAARARIAELEAALKQCRNALEAEATYHDGIRWQYIIEGDEANAATDAARAALEKKND